MRKYYKYEPTAVEVACGVTEDAVADMLPQALISAMGGIGGPIKVTLPADTGPALCTAVTRTVLGHSVFDFLGLNTLGMPVYGERF